jgi:uncharacterized peroxidase-related enzyme
MSCHDNEGRISMLERNQVTKEVGALYDKLLADRGLVPNMFKTVARVPALAQGFAALLGPLMGNGHLVSWYKELISIRVASLNTCEYCVSSHSYLAKLRGASLEQIAAVDSYESGPFTEKEKAGFRYADLLHASAHGIDEAAWEAIQLHYNDEEVIELTAVAAAFEFFPRFVAALEVPITPIPEETGR